jgi:hypothetical protein
MGASTAGFIVVKTGAGDKPYNYRDFYGPLDKGAAKPSFCYPSRKQDLQEEIDKGQKVLDSGYISKEKEMEFRVALNTKKKRMDEINAQESDARKLFKENEDLLRKRRETLAKEIAASMPSREAVKKKTVNPHANLKKEKGGLEDKKREFVILSRLGEEESNTSFLQRDKG